MGDFDVPAVKHPSAQWKEAGVICRIKIERISLKQGC
jgi:hypothetical protein